MKGSTGNPEKGYDIVWSIWKHIAVVDVIMYKLYQLVSESTESYYLGITKNKLEQRFAGHRHAAKSGKPSPIYNAMRKYKDFKILLISEYETREACCAAEVAAIKLARMCGDVLYNITSGGDGGYTITDAGQKAAWKIKLSIARKGAKPALGMKHTDINKKVFSDCGKKRWDMYGPLTRPSLTTHSTPILARPSTGAIRPGRR